MRVVVDFLSAGASLAAIAGVMIQVYLIRRDTRSRTPAAAPAGGAVASTPSAGGVATSTPPAAPSAGAAGRTAPYTPPERAGGPPIPPASILASPPKGASGSGVGSFVMGVWQLFWILAGLGWSFTYEQYAQPYDGTPEELTTSLRLAVVILLVNGVWAALLARRHWPPSGQPVRSAKDRLWFYLAYAPISALTGIVLLIARSDLIF